jgi:hypothetical protein
MLPKDAELLPNVVSWVGVCRCFELVGSKLEPSRPIQGCRNYSQSAKNRHRGTIRNDSMLSF